MTALITLTVAGTDSGPFNLYSDLDGYISAFETAVDKGDLLAGYLSVLVPDGTNTVRVMSVGLYCNTYVDIVLEALTTTSTTTVALTTTTTTTIVFPPQPTFLEDAYCDDYVVTSDTEEIFAEAVTGATQYRFLLENISQPYSQTFDSPDRIMTLADFTGLLPSTAYSVRVTSFLNGEWQPYNKTCSIITPA